MSRLRSHRLTVTLTAHVALLSIGKSCVANASSPFSPSGSGPPFVPTPPGATQEPVPLPSNQFDGDMSGMGGMPSDTFDAPGDHVAVEDRLSAWRQQQQERYEHSSPEQLNSIVDDEGRTKLLTTMSRTSVPIMFFILLSRSIHHFELADASFKKGVARVLFVLPTVLLFLGNLSGIVVGAMTSVKGTGGTKRRLKAILNINKLIEVLCMIYNVTRLAVYQSKYVPREVYVARTVTNFMFLSFSHVYTKVTWGGVKAQDPMLSADTSYGNSYYGNFEEEDSNEYQSQQQSYTDYGQQNQQYNGGY